eukprot:gene9209-10183_t
MEFEVNLKNAWIHKPGRYYANLYFKQNGRKVQGEVNSDGATPVEEKEIEWQVGPWNQVEKSVKTYCFGSLQLCLKHCEGDEKIVFHVDLFEEVLTPIPSTSSAPDKNPVVFKGSGHVHVYPTEVLHLKDQNPATKDPFNGRVFIQSEEKLGGLNLNLGWISLVNEIRMVISSSNLDPPALSPKQSVHLKPAKQSYSSIKEEHQALSPLQEISRNSRNSPLQEISRNRTAIPSYHEEELPISPTREMFNVEESFPGVDAVRQILPRYSKLLRSPPQSRSSVKPYVTIEEPVQSIRSEPIEDSNEKREEMPKELASQSSQRSATVFSGDKHEKANNIDNHVVSVMEYQTKELERYRMAVSQMGNVIVELRREISELKIKNGQLRARVYYNDDSMPLDEYEVDELAVAGANTSQVDILKRRLLSKSEETQQQKQKIQELQNSLIKANEYEKNYLQLRKAHELQQSVLQELQTKMHKYRLLQKTCKDQQRIIEELEKQTGFSHGTSHNGHPTSYLPAKRNKVQIEGHSRTNKNIHQAAGDGQAGGSYQGGQSVVSRTVRNNKDNFLDFDIEDRLTLLQKLEKAEGRIMALENQASKNARLWAKEKSQFRLGIPPGDFSDAMLRRDAYSPPLPPLADRGGGYDSYFLLPQRRLQGVDRNPRYHYLKTRLLPNLKPCLRKVVCSQNYGTPALKPLTETLDQSLVSNGSPEAKEVKVTELDNGVRVASVESEGGVSRVSVFVQAGSRYEDASNLGITHMLRNAAFLTNKEKSALGMVREIQQNGGGLEASCSRDHFIYSGSCTRDGLPNVLESITAAISGPMFQHWEMKDAKHLCNLDHAMLDVHHQNRLLDSLHGAAYRNGLGNSMFCPQHVNFSGPELQNYAANNFVGERLAVVGVGCDHQVLVKNVSSMLGSFPAGTAIFQDKQKYHSGEVRLRNSSKLTHAAFVAEGAGHQSKDLLSFGLLQMVMGSSSFIKWGSSTVSSRLNRSALAVAQNPFMVSSLNISHSDSGLFGFYAITESADSSAILKAALGELKTVANGKIDDGEFNRAKNQLKASILMAAESKDALVEDIANQMFSNRGYTAADSVCSEIDALKKDHVVAVAGQLLNGKPTLAVSGDCSSAPYLDELL